MRTRPLLLTFLLLILLLVAHRATAQTNPCQAPAPTGTVLNPTTIYFESPDHDATIVDTTTPVIESYLLGITLDGATSPMTQINVPRANVTRVAGTTPPCYSASVATPGSPIPSVPTGQKYSARLTAKASSGIADSDPSAASNPFTLQGRPRTATNVRLVKSS